MASLPLRMVTCTRAELWTSGVGQVKHRWMLRAFALRPSRAKPAPPWMLRAFALRPSRAKPAPPWMLRAFALRPSRARPAPPLAMPALALSLCALLAAPAEPRVVPQSEAASLVRIAGTGKPVVLHFWATWCDACRDEFPRIRKTLATLRQKGVAVLLVSIDKPQDLGQGKKDLRRLRGCEPSFGVLDAPAPGPRATALRGP